MPPEPTFFTDRDLGRQLPRALRTAGLRVEIHDDHFDPATADEVWLSEAGRRGWIVLTHDARIRHRSRERDAVMRAGVRAFVLKGKAPMGLIAEGFVRIVPKILRFLDRHPEPFLAKVYRDQRERAGRVEMWLSFAEWQLAARASRSPKPRPRRPGGRGRR